MTEHAGDDKYLVRTTPDMTGAVPVFEPRNFRYEQTGGYVTKDSGERQQFSTGMVRDVSGDKPRYDLLDLPMLKRWAELMARGSKKYGANNWRLASTEQELNRFKESALRHMFQWLEGDTTEDHPSAILFNVAGAEMVRAKLNAKETK